MLHGKRHERSESGLVAEQLIRISTVTPVYSGAPYLGQLVEQLAALKQQLESGSDLLRLAEAIFVVDGAIDDSEAVLADLREKHPWVNVVALSRNFGQHNATVAGILHTSGDWVVTLDEDLQHAPGDVPAMLLEAASTRADIVMAAARGGSHGNSWRDRSSRLAKRLIGWVSQNQFVAMFNSFRVMRGQVARATASVCSHQTYFDVAMVWFTDRIRAVPMELDDQRFNADKSSGYSLSRLLSHAKRLLMSSDLHLFKIAVLISGFSLLLTLGLGSYVVIGYWLDPATAQVRGWASLMGAILLYGGILSLLMGFVLEITKTNLFQNQGKPAFFVVDRDSDPVLESELRRLFEQDIR